MSAEADLLINAARKAACIISGDEFPAGAFSVKDIDFEVFNELVDYHEMAPFMHMVFKEYQGMLPQMLEQSFKSKYFYAIANNQQAQDRFLRLKKEFDRGGVDIVPIKGMSFLQDIYSVYPIRPMVDVDVLIKEEEIDRTHDILIGMGYYKSDSGFKESYWREKQCHFSYSEKTTSGFSSLVELHWILDFKRPKIKGLEQLWQRTLNRRSYAGTEVKLLSPEDALFSIALHQRRFGKALCLKYALDAFLILNKYKEDFDWDYVIEAAGKNRCSSTIYFLLVQVKVFLGFYIAEHIEKDLCSSCYRRARINKFIRRNTFMLKSLRKRKNLYLREHFILYDDFVEPVRYILNIPKEQFANFYNLKPYDKKTEFLYKVRIPYMLLRKIGEWLSF